MKDAPLRRCCHSYSNIQINKCWHFEKVGIDFFATKAFRMVLTLLKFFFGSIDVPFLLVGEANVTADPVNSFIRTTQFPPKQEKKVHAWMNQQLKNVSILNGLIVQ